MTTLKELAAILNVSVSTVSKALNDSPEIGEDTKQRVKQLAEELDYQPNRLAQQLKSNATRNIGVIIPTIINPFFSEVLHGIENYADAHQYDIITTISNESFEKEQRAIKMLARGSVDGFIIAAARETQMEQKTAHFQSVLNNHIPMVMFDRVVDQVSCAKVVVDDYESVYNATQNLINKKRQHFVLFSNIADLSVGKLRSQGFQDALKEAQLTFDVVDLKSTDNLKGTILHYLKTHPKTDAIISIDHLTGIVALNMAEFLGKTVPKDIDIVGFGYTETPLLVNNKIAIIQQKGEAIGYKTAELLIEQIKDKGLSANQTIVIPNGFNSVF